VEGHSSVVLEMGTHAVAACIGCFQEILAEGNCFVDLKRRKFGVRGWDCKDPSCKDPEGVL
jgi:hypothetical protein